MNFAGFPPTIAKFGIDLVTTDPAAITAPSPKCTPGRITALHPIQTSLPIELINLSLHNFLTGKGGILYKPQFFHRTSNLIFNDEIFLKTCSKQDDIWFHIIRIFNNIECYIGKRKWLLSDLSNVGLYCTFNKHNNTNSIAFKNTIGKLFELGYKLP